MTIHMDDVFDTVVDAAVLPAVVFIGDTEPANISFG